MDAIDRKILALLQTDGRMSVTELADRVGLSVSPTQRRLRALEADGVITGYRAVVDPRALDLGFEAIVFLTMVQEDRETLRSFEEALARIPSVLRAQRLFGDPDFLVLIRTRDLEAFTRVRDDEIADLPGVQKVTSTLVMKNLVPDRPFPTGV